MANIGKEIKRILKERGMSISEFARRINTHRRNVYDIFERKSVDSELLHNIGKILEYDFFIEYSIPKSKINDLEESAVVYQTTINTSKLLKEIEALQNEIITLKERLNDKETIIELLKNQISADPKF